MNFEQQLKTLVFFHLEEHSLKRDIFRDINYGDFALAAVAPPDDIKKNIFCEAVNYRGLEQLFSAFQRFQDIAAQSLPKEHEKTGEIISIYELHIDTGHSTCWIDSGNSTKKAKAHLGYNMNYSIPSKIFLADSTGDVRPFVCKILSPGQTGIMDRYYQCHKDFDLLQTEGKHFICRIKRNTRKTVIETKPIQPNSMVFSDSIVLLGTPYENQTEKPVRLIGYRKEGKEYWVATDRNDLSAEDIASLYKLRLNIDIFFGWWKRHLKVYHLIARSPYGLMVQILAGLVTYILLSIYCHNSFREKVSIKRVRELKTKINNEAGTLDFRNFTQQNFEVHSRSYWFANS